MSLYKVVTVVAYALAGMSPAWSQEVTNIKGGQSTELGAVYWVEYCQSRLQAVVSVEVTSGPPGITLSLRKQDVRAERQNCPNPVPGAVVVATAPMVSQPVTGTLKYQVTYLHTDGAKRRSEHTRQISIVP